MSHQHLCLPFKLSNVQPPKLSIVNNTSSASVLAAARPPISAPRPLMPTLVEQPAPKHKQTLQGVQRPQPSKAATVAGPPKAASGFPSRLAQASAGTVTASSQTISLAKTIKQMVLARTANIGESKLAQPASVVSPTTKTSGAPTQVPSKLWLASVVPKGLRPPT